LYTAALNKSDAAGTPEGARTDGGSLHVPFLVRYLDLVLLALALPVFVIGGLPIAGYAAAAGAWLAQRGVQALLQRRAGDSDDPRTIVGLAVASMMARGWIVAGAIFGVGLALGDEHGLAAAVLVIVLFTAYFTTHLMLRPLSGQDGRR
jgi:hypothetical protein